MGVSKLSAKVVFF